MPERLLQQLNTATSKFLTTLPLEQTYATVVEEAIKLVEGNDGLIALEQKGKLHIVYASSAAAGMPLVRRDYAYKALNTQTAFAVSVQSENKDEKIKSIIYIPLSYQAIPIGVLIVRSDTIDRFNKRELKTLELFGSTATLAIRKTELHLSSIRANEIRDLFLSATIHELRTPLTTINGYIHLLQKKLNNQDSLEYKWVEQLRTQSNKLTSLINDLMEMNQIRTGKLQYIWSECSLIEVINKAINDTNKLYPNRVIQMKQNNKFSDKLIGDFAKLYQVFSAVLDNALKFSDPEKKITINIKTSPKNLYVTIKDFGIGISDDELPHIFEEFFKGSHARVDDLGLGLYLSKNIINEHHGSISIKSKAGDGTSVHVKLPAAAIH